MTALEQLNALVARLRIGSMKADSFADHTDATKAMLAAANAITALRAEISRMAAERDAARVSEIKALIEAAGETYEASDRPGSLRFCGALERLNAALRAIAEQDAS